MDATQFAFPPAAVPGSTYFPQFASPIAPQLAPQGFFGSLLGGPVGGLIGNGIGGLFGNPTLGRQIGQTAGTIGGSFLPFNVDPMTAAYAQQVQQAQAQQIQQAQLAQQLAQQGQLAPQGFFGSLLGQIGQPLGSAVGSIFGNPALGGQLGGAAAQFGRFLPFNVDPITAAYAQQAQLASQGFYGNMPPQFGQLQPGQFGQSPPGQFGLPYAPQTFAGGGVPGQYGRYPSPYAIPGSSPMQGTLH